MKNRVIWISLVVVVVAWFAFMQIWSRHDKDTPSPAPTPTAGTPVPAPPAAVEEMPTLSRPPTDEELARMARWKAPVLPVEDRPLESEPMVPLIRQNIAVMVDEGSIEHIKPSLLSYSPEELAAALDAATVEIIEKKHADVPPTGRCLSAWLLGMSRDPGVSAFLARQLASEQDVSVRIALLGALSTRDDDEAVSAAVRAVASDAAEGVRIAAAGALVSLAGTRDAARGALIDRLRADGESEAVRKACAKALGRVPRAEAADALVAIVENGPAGLREAAAWGLSGHTTRLDGTWLESKVAAEPPGPVRAALNEVLNSMKEELPR